MSDVKLLKGDCLELMKDIEDKSIDLILCDLPYGLTNNVKDVALPLDLLWKEYKRIIKDKGAILLFCQGLFFVDLVNSNRKMYRYDLVWDKGMTSGFLNAKRMPLRKHEQIAVFYKSMPTYNPQFSKGKPLHGRGKSYLDKEMKNQNYGNFSLMEDVRKGTTDKYPTSILGIKKPHPSVTVHPTQKPVELLEYLIKTYSNEGDLVLDNCMGSGSTGVACVNTNRNFIGMEVNDEYFEIAEQRLNEAEEMQSGISVPNEGLRCTKNI